MDLTIWHYLLLASAGVIAGFVNVMAGGGSLLVLPIMLFLGIEGPVANGTNRLGILSQNWTAVGKFAHKGYFDLKLSLTLTLCALPGAFLGAFLGTKLSGVWFNRTLGCVMIMVMILMFLKKKDNTGTGRVLSKKRLIAGHILMFIAGLYGGFIQAGVGFILMTILHRVMHLDLLRTNMYKVFIVGCYTIVALAVFAFRGYVIWLPAIVLAVGTSIGAYISTHLAIKKGQGIIKIIFTIAIIALAIKLLVS